jgi:hypothetical protein
MRMRAVDAAECYPFVGGCCSEGEGELPPRFPQMDPKPLPRWWKHELAAGQAHLLAGAKGGEAAAAGCRGGGLRKGTKRKAGGGGEGMGADLSGVSGGHGGGGGGTVYNWLLIVVEMWNVESIMLTNC